MGFLKEINKGSLATSICWTIVGLVLTVFPTATAKMIGYGFAVILLVAGAAFMYRYITKEAALSFTGHELVASVCLFLGGIYVLFNVESIVSIIPFLLGIIIVMSGVSKLQSAISMQRLHYSGATTSLVLAFINIIFGIVIIFNAFKAATLIIFFIGVGLVFSGLSDIVVTLFVSRSVAKMKKESEVIEAEARDVD